MSKRPPYWIAFGAFVLMQCGTMEHGLTDGYYTLKTKSGASQRVYATVRDSAITAYSLSDPKSRAVDTAQARSVSGGQAVTLVKRNIDADLTTVLFKYRFSTGELPNQINSNLNAALYLGYRTDYFHLYETTTPLKRKERRMRHFEIDGGLFAGIGSSPINATVTLNRLDSEYDGFVFQKGAALFMGSGNLTFGIGMGADALLDKNKSIWVYHEQLWLGLMIGLNLSG